MVLVERRMQARDQSLSRLPGEVFLDVGQHLGEPRPSSRANMRDTNTHRSWSESSRISRSRLKALALGSSLIRIDVGIGPLAGAGGGVQAHSACDPFEIDRTDLPEGEVNAAGRVDHLLANEHLALSGVIGDA